MVWELDRSTKFFVVAPVPPFAIAMVVPLHVPEVMLPVKDKSPVK